ncbi:phosphatidylserine decarboxylase family protein [Hippea alviniae]|uniref:phosphatidylserine decarboxylase family protein n=1 Tax=Hippea alviniae TaxID=1279027 RepID=UPI00041FA3CC|nr:phosphatidylserine decarboxylase family protein [Hippea alviniae]
MSLKTKEGDIIAKEGYPFIAGGLISAALFYKLNLKTLAAAGGLFGLYSLYFFRNPTRKPPVLKRAIVSPADGKVISIGEHYERYFFKREVKRISVFMSLFDVHINRMPADGKIVSIVYKPGEFLSAFKEKASDVNEQTALLLDLACGKRVVVVQIAGLVARRVVTYPKEGQELKKGEIFGMIRFGSRLDVYVEDEFEETVRVKEKVKAGESILGIFK